jgi:hypothetical protein
MNGKEILAFHIGRGGRFHNPGHLTFIGFKAIDRFTDDLFMNEDETEYIDSNGNEVGLSVDNDGTGRIDIDRDYDTTYCKYLDDLDENEMDAIMRDEFNLGVLEYYVKNVNPQFEYDLFAHTLNLPKNVIDIIFDEIKGYAACIEAIAKLEAIGYTADFGLDGELIDLRIKI